MPALSSFPDSYTTDNYSTIPISGGPGDANSLITSQKPIDTSNKQYGSSALLKPDTGTANGGIWNRTGVGNGSSSKAKLLYGLICISQLFLFMSWSIIAPFFPPEAEQQGATPSQVGIIFGIYSLIQFITAPVWGKFIPVLGARSVFIMGYIMTAIVDIGFGFVDRTPPGTPFVATCLLARAFQGIGTSAVFTSAMTMVAYTFPKSVGRLVGLLEVFTGIGLMIGPFIGGVLYELGGFLLPFVSLGCCMLLNSLVLILMLPKDDYADRHKPGSYLALLNIPGTWIGISTGFIAALSFTVLEPTLALQLEEFDINAVGIGLVFLLLGLVYGSTSPFFGWLAEKRISSRTLVLGGMLVSFVAYIILGPWAPLNITASLPQTCVSIVLASLSFGLSFAPGFQEILVSGTFNGMPLNMSTYSVLSGTFNSAYSLGSFIGPVLAGGLVQTRGFAFMSSVIGLLNILVFLFGIVLSCWEFRCGNGRRRYILSRRYEYPSVDPDGNEDSYLMNEQRSA